MPRTSQQSKKWAGTKCRRCFTATYVDEIAAVRRSGGQALVGEKLAALSEAEQRVLREALGEPELL
jgi:hypothetical protein